MSRASLENCRKAIPRVSAGPGAEVCELRRLELTVRLAFGAVPGPYCGAEVQVPNFVTVILRAPTPQMSKTSMDFSNAFVQTELRALLD